MRTIHTKTPADDVDRALASAQRAASKLVELLGHEDVEVLKKASMALPALERLAVDRLVAALPRAKNPRHRAAIIVLLNGLGAQSPSAVGMA